MTLESPFLRQAHVFAGGCHDLAMCVSHDRSGKLLLQLILAQSSDGKKSKLRGLRPGGKMKLFHDPRQGPKEKGCGREAASLCVSSR